VVKRILIGSMVLFVTTAGCKAATDDLRPVEPVESITPAPVVPVVPVPVEPQVVVPPLQQQVLPPPVEPEVYYKNCSSARAAGAAPVYAGDPGYRPALDRDGDGIGCE
jgi:hypothetical protein